MFHSLFSLQYFLRFLDAIGHGRMVIAVYKKHSRDKTKPKQAEQIIMQFILVTREFLNTTLKIANEVKRLK